MLHQLGVPGIVLDLSMTPRLAIVLAAGQGTRMKSSLPKVLHTVCGIPLLGWVLRGLDEAGVKDTCIVVGHGAETVEAWFEGHRFARQEQQLGTAHAVMSAKKALATASGSVLVLSGDVPMLRASTIKAVCELRESTGAGLAMATFRLPNPKGYGRIVRDDQGKVCAIVEEKDCTPEQRQIGEVNPAVYCFDAATLMELLPQVGNDNAQGEYYLPDLVKLIRDSGGTVETWESDAPDEFLGINDRWQLAEANEIVRKQILRHHAENGVTLLDINSICIGPDVRIGSDTVVYPNTVIEGSTFIGQRSHIGPNTWIKSSEIADEVRVFMSHLDHASMSPGSRCGPFANLRPGSVIRDDVKIGNFVETKNAEIGPRTSISHLTYIGDATVGTDTNIGAGTITCNYDGFDKHRTQIGDRCFIGSNSTLVAPVTVESDGFVAAGSVINRNVPSGAMAIGRGRQEIREQWYTAWRERKISEKK